LELVNEVALCIFGYTMLLFAGLSRPMSDDQFQTGRIVALVVILFIYSVNMSIMMKTTGYQVCLKLRGTAIQKQKCLWILKIFPLTPEEV